MSQTLDFYFDFSCPYAYLGSTQVEALAARCGVELVPKPILLGGVFRARETPQNLAGSLSPSKAKHNLEDMQRWAVRFGAPLVFPAGHPNRTVSALRCLLAVGEPFMPLVHRFYEAYWGRGEDISDPAVVRRVLLEAGHNADEVLERSVSPEVKQELRRRTDEALDVGLFGVPGFVVDGELYWGQDRLDVVERALGGDPPALVPGQPGEHLPVVDLWFDYASPFAYLGVQRARSLFGASLRLRPMLRGAVFKMVEAPNVPFFAMNEAKRSWVTRDLHRQAVDAGIAFSWPEGFPFRTVLPLRMTLLALERDSASAEQFISLVFDFLWRQGGAPEDGQALQRLAEEVGLDGAGLLADASSDSSKKRLRDATDEAVAAGVFGAPTLVVHGQEGPLLFWGNDRLGLALDVARRSGARSDGP